MMNSPLKTLIVDDCADDAALVVRELCRDGSAVAFVRVETEEALVKALRCERWDIVLSEFNLPHLSAVRVLELLKSSGVESLLIVVSRGMDLEATVEAMRHGAENCLLKSRLDRLGEAVEAALKRKTQCSSACSRKVNGDAHIERTQVQTAISEPGESQQDKDATIRFLHLVNESSGTRDLVKTATAFFQDLVGCDAVGVRLRQMKDYPYLESSGLSEDFLASENSLHCRDIHGQILVDDEGLESLDCMCGNVICGRFDASKPYFTAKGSFWTNSATEFTRTTAVLPEWGRMRNVCHSAGYESVALLPLSLGQTRLGLLQLNARRSGVFSPCMIRLCENLVDQLAVALARFRAEEAFRETHARYRSLFENMMKGYMRCRMIFKDGQPVDFVCLEINNSFETVTGLKDVVGKKVSDIFPHMRDRSPRLFEIYGRVALTGKSERFEIYLEDLRSWFSASAYSFEKEIFVAVFDNITARKNTEQALCEAEEKYRGIFEHAADGIFRSTPGGKLLDVNPSFAAMHGYDSPSECIAATPDVAQHLYVEPHRRMEFRRELDRLGEVRRFESRNRCKDGRIIWAEISAWVKNDSQGNVIYEGFVRDITERKRIEEDRMRLATAVEQAVESIVITDGQGRILYVNPAFERISGYSKAEALGQTPRILKSGRHDATFYGQMWRTILGGEVWIGHLFNKRKNETVYEEETIISPIRGPEGNIVNFVAVKRDVTHEVQLENKLRQAQKLEAIGRLAGGVAHDFNNVLMAVLGFSDLCLKGMRPEHPLHSYLGEVKAAGERGASLTRQLLMFSRKQVVQPRVLSLNDVVQNLQKMLRRLIGEDIELNIQIGEGLNKVKADPGQMEQVIMNLAINARDAMASGGKLSIETANVHIDETWHKAHADIPPGAYVALSITDTGTGMTSEVRSHLFEPFFTTKEQGRGTGLGLATVYDIVKVTGGCIDVETELNKGTTFRIYLPTTSEVESETSGSTAETLSRSKETVLLVEDDEHVRKLIRALLESEGHTVLEAANGSEALDRFSNCKPAIRLLVSDVVMPGLAGADVAKLFQALYRNISVLLISGYPLHLTDDVITRTWFLPKPFAADVLIKKVRTILQMPVG